MKLARFSAAFLFSLAIFSSLTFAETVDIKAQFEQIKTSAENYEAGKITYLQLKAESEALGEKIRRSVSEGFIKVKEGEKDFEGLSTAAIENLLGPPTETTNHVWITNEEKESSSEKPLPGWRKTIFNGKKIKISANAWPQIFRTPDGDQVFYWLGFDFFFKKEYDLDTAELADSMKKQAEAYYRTGQGMDVLARNIATNQKVLREYLEQNREDCVSNLKTLVGGETSEKLTRRTEGTLYSGKNIQVRMDGNSCENCEDFSWFNLNSWIEAFDRSYQPDEQMNLGIPKDAYKGYSLEQLYSELERILTRMKQDAQTYDATKNQQFSKDFSDFRSALNSISQAINEKTNDWNTPKEERARAVKARDEKIAGILEKFLANKKTEVVKEVQVDKRLLSFNETKTGTHCEGRYNDCGPGGMCSGSQCVARPPEERGPQPTYTGPTGRICPQVCVPMWENRNGRCEFNQCGSGCGADNQNSFNSETECRNRFGISPATTQISAGNETQQSTSTTALSSTTSTAAQTTTTAQATTSTSQSTTTTAQATTTTTAATTTTAGPTGGFISGYEMMDQGPPQTASPEDSCVKKGCNQNQFCNSENGWCQCAQGFNDCDGDGRNGCESQGQCKPCNPGSECGPSRCSEGGYGIENFVCVQDQGWEQEVAAFEMHGSCSFGQSSEPNGWIGFNGWGEKFDKLNQLVQSSESQNDWCSKELSSLMKERREIENSFKAGFAETFMKDFVAENPEDFEIYGRSFGSLYWSIVDNTQRIAQNLQCLKRTDWPDVEPIFVKTETAYGKIEIFELPMETNHFGEKMKVMTPYMRMWMFPPKEVFKQFMFKDLREGKIGPDEKDQGGPSPAEVAEIKKNEQAYNTIKNIAKNFGGDANIIFSVKDKGEELFKMHMQVNPEIIMQMRPALDYSGEVDATLSIDFDYFYDMISGMEKGRAVHTETPPWDKSPRAGEDIGGAAEGIKFFTGIVGGILTGKVTVSPISAWPAIVSSFGDLLKMMSMGG